MNRFLDNVMKNEKRETLCNNYFQCAIWALLQLSVLRQNDPRRKKIKNMTFSPSFISRTL